MNSGFTERLVIFAKNHVFTFSRLRTFAFRLMGMKIGRDTLLQKLYCTWPHQVSIGNNCRLEHCVYFHFDGVYQQGPSILIGNNCFLGAACEFNVRNKVLIGDNCQIAAGVRFIDHDHDISGVGPFPNSDGPSYPIIINDHVWIGANAIILKGVQIGSGAVIGAGAVVTKSIPENEIWAGIPASRISCRSIHNITAN